MTLDRIINMVELSSVTSTQTSSRNPSIAACLAKLKSIPGMSPDDELYVWAARLFLRDKLRECFMTLPTDKVRLRFLKLEIEMEKTNTEEGSRSQQTRHDNQVEGDNNEMEVRRHNIYLVTYSKVKAIFDGKLAFFERIFRQCCSVFWGLFVSVALCFRCCSQCGCFLYNCVLSMFLFMLKKGFLLKPKAPFSRCSKEEKSKGIVMDEDIRQEKLRGFESCDKYPHLDPNKVALIKDTMDDEDFKFVCGSTYQYWHSVLSMDSSVSFDSFDSNLNAVSKDFPHAIVNLCNDGSEGNASVSGVQEGFTCSDASNFSSVDSVNGGGEGFKQGDAPNFNSLPKHRKKVIMGRNFLLIHRNLRQTLQGDSKFQFVHQSSLFVVNIQKHELSLTVMHMDESNEEPLSPPSHVLGEPLLPLFWTQVVKVRSRVSKRIHVPRIPAEGPAVNVPEPDHGKRKHESWIEDSIAIQVYSDLHNIVLFFSNSFDRLSGFANLSDTADSCGKEVGGGRESDKKNRKRLGDDSSDRRDRCGYVAELGVFAGGSGRRGSDADNVGEVDAGVPEAVAELPDLKLEGVREGREGGEGQRIWEENGWRR
ncbi:hypothetical protein TEA_017164 [Camellia sinensis var. sinensis]|uniref:Uncharacterized protein n=1 Tax=Camellia sinensis var. sinensis TaxID=542762 RepID=A0A4S4ENF6_CAMSN|nr:hypothetical protein TEA_017164 [Camellia sinensis var. sinensis]